MYFSLSQTAYHKNGSNNETRFPHQTFLLYFVYLLPSFKSINIHSILTNLNQLD